MKNTAMETCANPGCDQPGTNKCAGCKSTLYCGPICQTAHWPTHKESCDGRLRKMGMDHLAKAMGFYRENNWSQLLRYSDLALTKLKQLKDRPIEATSQALSYKCEALGFLGQFREQLECAKEWYCLWNTKPTDVGAIQAAFALIDSCIHKELDDAVLYASTLYEIINHKHDNKIPDDQRQRYIATGAFFLGQATLQLAKNGGIPAEGIQKAGQGAILLVRRALEIHTRLHGTEDDRVANDMCVLAEALDFFNGDGDDEALRLFERSKSIYARLYGSLSVNIAVIEQTLGLVHYKSAKRAHDVNDLERHVTNLNLALSHFVEAARIYRAINRIELADNNVQKVEEQLRNYSDPRIAATTAGGGGGGAGGGGTTSKG